MLAEIGDGIWTRIGEVILIEIALLILIFPARYVDDISNKQGGYFFEFNIGPCPDGVGKCFVPGFVCGVLFGRSSLFVKELSDFEEAIRKPNRKFDGSSVKQSESFLVWDWLHNMWLNISRLDNTTKEEDVDKVR